VSRLGNTTAALFILQKSYVSGAGLEKSVWGQFLPPQKKMSEGGRIEEQ